jgi:uncharacterized protein (TIGR00251 family)
LIAETATGVELEVRVIPRAKKSCLGGVRDGAVLVRLAAPPVENEANDALISFLSELLHVPRRAIRIVSGGRARHKRVAVDGLAREVARTHFGL